MGVAHASDYLMLVSMVMVGSAHVSEKLVTGEEIESKPTLRQDMHLRLLEVGTFKTLV